MKTYFLLFFLLLQSTYTPEENTFFTKCLPYGNARQNSIQGNQNFLKNRIDTFPDKTIYEILSIDTLLNSQGNQYEFYKKNLIGLKGYIYDIQNTGPENCNCKTQNHLLQDCHIVVTPDENHTSAQYRVIVEITPRIRYQNDSLKSLYITSNLRQKFLNKIVLIQGLLFYDVFHENASWNSCSPKNRLQCWRGTCWEIHPVFSIVLLE